MSHTVLIDGDRMQVAGLTFTNTDPGGCETASITCVGITPPRPGAPVLICDGAKPVWIGNVEEPGTRTTGVAAPVQVGCVGRKIMLSRDRMSMVFLDPGLTEWTAPARDRMLDLIENTTPPWDPSGPGEVLVDPDNRTPCLRQSITGTWSGSVARPLVEALYDAGFGNSIAKLVYAWTRGSKVDSSDTNWAWYALTANTTKFDSSVSISSNLRAAGPGSGVQAANASGHRYACVELYYTYSGANSSGSDGVQYTLDWTRLIVVGDHGIDLDSEYKMDVSSIVAYVAARSRITADLDIARNSAPISRLVYKTKVPYQQIIDDMVKYTGWHFGVWAPNSALADRPVVRFQAPPPKETVIVDYGELENIDLTERASAMNSQAVVTYSTPDGTQATTTVQRTHPRIGLDGGTLDVDAGVVGSSDVAAAYGLYVLALDQAQSRVAGSVTLPRYLRRPGGGVIPANHLKAGIDRLRITSIPTNGQILSDPPQRVDSFRISRVTVDEAGGAVNVTVELDSGADLIEVLQARFANSDPSGTLTSG